MSLISWSGLIFFDYIYSASPRILMPTVCMSIRPGMDVSPSRHSLLVML
jgi:hypothetical protein